MKGGDCEVSSARCGRDRSGRSSIVPVRSTDNNRVRTKVSSTESEVVSREGAVRETDIAEVASNGTVEPDLVARGTVKVVPEQSKASMELFEDDGLGLDLANLFGDDPLGHLLEDEETLLDDLDLHGVADESLGGIYDLGEMDRAVEVIDTIEVVKVVKGRETTPVVERDRGAVTAREDISADRDWLGNCAGNESRGNKEGGSEFGEHGERVRVALVRELVKRLKKCKVDSKNEKLRKGTRPKN